MSCLTLSPTATIPTIGDALEALNALCTDLGQTLKQISDISAELAARDHIGVENIQEVQGPVHHLSGMLIGFLLQVILDIQPSFLQDLDIGQKRALIYQELEKIQKAARRDAKILLGEPSRSLSSVYSFLTLHMLFQTRPRCSSCSSGDTYNTTPLLPLRPPTPPRPNFCHPRSAQRARTT